MYRQFFHLWSFSQLELLLALTVPFSPRVLGGRVVRPRWILIARQLLDLPDCHRGANEETKREIRRQNAAANPDGPGEGSPEGRGLGISCDLSPIRENLPAFFKLNVPFFVVYHVLFLGGHGNPAERRRTFKIFLT